MYYNIVIKVIILKYILYSDKGLNQFKQGLFFGVSQGIIQICYGVTFLVGSKLVDKNEIEFYMIFR